LVAFSPAHLEWVKHERWSCQHSALSIDIIMGCDHPGATIEDSEVMLEAHTTVLEALCMDVD